MRATPKPQGKAMYVAFELDTSWLLSKQRILYARSAGNPDYVFRKLWGLITEPANLRIALARVARNKGRRTGGVDRVTVHAVLKHGAEAFLQEVRSELRAGLYRPSPVRRVLIPKPGQPGKFRPLGIPTVRDRIVQAAVKNILEPIFEADFYPTSYGFRPGRSVHGAIEHLQQLLRPRTTKQGKDQRLSYQWAIEGDIKGCFDNISHHGLMERVRRRIGDAKVNRLILAFLKAGVLSEKQFARTDDGTPQGGILSPLLANIALSELDERYERQVWPRRAPTLRTDPEGIQRRAAANRATLRRRGDVVLFPIRYADDFLILVSAPPGPEQNRRAEQAAQHEKAEVATLLKERLNLELSEAKTLVTPVTNTIRFLGHQVRVRYVPQKGRIAYSATIPRDKSHRLREGIKRHFARSTIGETLENRLRKLNPVLRGWSTFYRHAHRAKRVLSRLDNYVWWTIFRWLKKKHHCASARTLFPRYGWRQPGGRATRWRDGSVVPFRMARTRTGRFRLAWIRPPDFALTSAESPVHNERCTPGSEGGARKPAGES
jgi:group II intron reverse transcriptase/maturase